MINQRSILVVDDETDFLSSIRRLLRKEPYAVLTADNGKTALNLLSEKEISIVLSDYRMPGINGLALLQHVRAQYPQILTIMLTAISEIELAMKAINEAGVYKFFLKPVEIHDLKLTLKRALEHLDLVEERNGLRRELNVRDTLLQRLENKCPGITKVERDKSGVYILKE
ncbi:MAG: response regulator [Desulfobacterales bacterium]|nr:response regulator [Desulfobacterales bacterium]